MKKNNRKFLILAGLIAVVVLLLVLLVFLYKKKMNQIYDKFVVSVELSEEEYSKLKDEEYELETKKLSEMSEQKRVYYYASKFRKAIENRNYSEAYDYLNKDFKTNYFNTLDSFEKYAKKYFPKDMSTDYKNMERLGDIYVIDVDVKDIFSSDPNDFSFYIVVKEHAYNDFEMSFSVDKPMAKYQQKIDTEE